MRNMIIPALVAACALQIPFEASALTVSVGNDNAPRHRRYDSDRERDRRYDRRRHERGPVQNLIHKIENPRPPRRHR